MSIELFFVYSVIGTLAGCAISAIWFYLFVAIKKRAEPKLLTMSEIIHYARLAEQGSLKMSSIAQHKRSLENPVEPDPIEQMTRDPIWQAINQAALDAGLCYKCGESKEEEDIAKGCKCPGVYVHRLDRYVKGILDGRIKSDSEIINDLVVKSKKEDLLNHARSNQPNLMRMGAYDPGNYFYPRLGSTIVRQSSHVGSYQNKHFLELVSHIHQLYNKDDSLNSNPDKLNSV